MKEKIIIMIRNDQIKLTNLLLGGSITNTFDDLVVDEDNTIDSLDLLNYFDSTATSFTATSNLTDLVNVSINNTNLDITLVQNAYSNAANSLNQGEVLSFTIPNDYQGELKYFCYTHSSMIANFTIEDAPVDTSSINTKFFVRLNSDPFSSPYYIFSSTENGTSLDVVLYRGISYEFERTDSGHPFNIGSNHNENTTGIVITSNGTGGIVYSEALITVSATDGSSTVNQSFKIKVNPINDEAIGTVTFTDNVIINQTITGIVDLSDNDGSLTLSYQWQVSDDNSTFTNTDSTDLNFVIPSNYVGKYIRLQVTSVDGKSVAIENSDFETGVTIQNGYLENFTPPGWIENGNISEFNRILVNGTSSTYLSLENNNSMIGFRHGRRLYQEITGYNGYYTLTFDLIKRQHGSYESLLAPDFTVLINNEVKFSEQVSNNTIEQRTIIWFNDEDTIRIEFASNNTTNEDKTFFIDNVSVNYTSNELSTTNSYSRQVKDVFGDIQVNTNSSDTVIKLENTYTFYNSYYVLHHRSDEGYENLIYTIDDHDAETFYNDIEYLKNHYITIPDFSGDTFYTFDVSIYDSNNDYNQLKLRDPDGNKPELTTDTYYTFNVYSFIGNSSLYYSNVTSSDANIVPTLSSTWDQIGSSIYGEREYDKSGNAVSLSSDGTIVAIGEYNNYADANSDNYGSVRVFERINNEWTQKGSKLTGEQEMDWFGDQVKLSGDGTKLFVGATAYDIDVNDPNNSNGGKLYIYTFTNNDWNLVNSIEGTGDNNKMFFDISDDGTIFAINDNFNNKIKIYEYNYNDNTYTLKGSEISGSNNFEDQISLSGDGNSILITDNGNNYYVYSYDNDWVQKGSTVISDQGRGNSSLKLNYDGSAFIYGGNQYNSRFVKTISVGGDVGSVITKFENEGYSLYTAYFGTNDGTNLSSNTKYETLNSSKLLNIYDYNKIRYDVYNFTGDYDSPDGGYQKTSYSNDIYKFNVLGDSIFTDTSNELYQIAGSNINKYIKTSGFFSPKDSGYYRLAFNETDDGVRVRMREFTNATDIESDSRNIIPLIRTNSDSTNYFKYAVYTFNQNYSAPFDSTAFRNTHESNTLLEWDSDNNTSNWSVLAINTTVLIYIRTEVIFSPTEDDTYNFELRSDDGIRIKIVEFNDQAPDPNTSSDWPSMTHIDTTEIGATNWGQHGFVNFSYQISLQKHKIYKAYIEYAQGNMGYGFSHQINRTGDATYKKFENMFTLYDTSSTWDSNNNVWIDKDSFSNGVPNLDIGLYNIYLDSTKNYEFLIEFAQGEGGVSFNFYAEKTDTDSFTSLPSSISTEFVSLVNLKSKFEVLKEQLTESKFKYDVYSGTDLNNLTNGRTHYKNELLSWTGLATVDTTNLSLLTEDLGDETVTVRISGYFSPVETNNYRFRFLDNDDAVGFYLIEFGNDINNGAKTLSNNTSNAILLESTKTYEFKIVWRQATGYYKFELQVDIGNSGTFVDFYNTSNFDFKVYNDYNALDLIISTSAGLGLYDPNVGVDKFTYLVFNIEDAPGKNKVYEYKTDIEGNTDWYQVGNDILGLSPGGFGGWRTILDKSGRQIATTDVRHDGGTVRILKHDPIGTSIRNFYGSGINSSSTILANNEKLYQGSNLVSPNGNYQLSFQYSDGNLVLYDISTSVTPLYGLGTDGAIGDNQSTAYVIMEDGNLNIYDENGDHRFSFGSGSTSGVLALDNNGNLSIVDNWIEVKRFSGGDEEGSGIDFSLDGSVIAIGTKNNNNYKGRTEIYELNNELTLGNVNSLIVGSSTDISFNVMDGTHIDTKTFTISNIDDSTFGELRIISNTTNLYEGGTLTADTSSIIDPDGTVNVTSYEWQISNSSDFTEFSIINSATNSSFTIPKDSESSFSYVGQYIRLKVVVDNNTDYFSNPRLVINIEDEATGTVSFTSDFNLILEESLLTAVTNISDVDNNRLITDTNNVGSLTLNYQWQISDDNNTFTNIDTDGTASTYKIPLGVYDKYIRLLVTTTDIRGGTTEILSSSRLIEKLNLVTQTSISDSNYLEDNDYVFDLSSIIFNNFDVSFSIKTDDTNGSSTINNNLLTFSPNNNYYGESTVVVTASSPSITTITQDITFTIDIQPVDDKPSGTVTFTDNVIINQIITASVNLTDTDGPLTLGYQWQVSDDNSNFTNISSLESQGLTFVIPSDYVGKYIRLQVSSVDSEGGVTVVNSYSRQVKDVFGDIQVNSSSDNTVIKLENIHSLNTDNIFDGEVSLYYSNFTSTNTNVVPTLSSTWDQIGSSLYGDNTRDKSGNSVSLSSDGNILAIGEFNPDSTTDIDNDKLGSVRVFEYINNEWTLKGSKLFGEQELDLFGNQVVLSGDGTKLFVTAPHYDNSFTNAGKLYIYTFTNNDWNEVKTIEGTYDDHSMGVLISDDGNVFAINKGIEDKLYIYNYNYNDNSYSQKGSTIACNRVFSLSGDGNHVVLANDNEYDVKVYTYNSSQNDWVNSSTVSISHNNIKNLIINYDGTVFMYSLSFSSAPGINAVYEYKNNSWNQLGSYIYGLTDTSWGGWRNTMDKSGKLIATLDVRYNSGTIRLLKYNPIKTSIYNFNGSGINSSSTILANNEKLYQGSYITSPNGNYVLIFQENNGNLVLRYNSDPTIYSVENDYNTFTVIYNFNLQNTISEGNPNTYIVMEDGNLNIYDNGILKQQYTSGSTSCSLALDNNGNLSIVDSDWVEVKRISGDGAEEGIGLQLSSDGTRLASGSRDFTNTLSYQGRVEVYELNNELTLANVNSLTIGSSTDISFDVTDGTEVETKTFTVSNIDNPTFGEIRILSNTINLYEGGTLTADTTSLTDPDGTINLTYQWEISPDSNTYTSITDATNSTFTIPRDSESSFSYVGQYIRLKVVANGTEFYSEPKLILNIEDEAIGTISFTSNLTLIQEGAILTAVTNLSDVDNNKLVSNNSQGTLSLAYQWQISEDNISFTNISGATSNEYQIPIGTYTGQYIRLFITTTDTRSGTTDFVTTSSLIDVNSSPFFNTNPITTAYVGILYSYSFTFSDADENQTINITDISYPNWLTFDTNNNTLSGTPTISNLENNDVSIIISDGTNETIQSFSIYVNRAPYVGTDLNLTFDEDEVINPIDLDLYFSDYDNDTLNYTIDSYDTNFFAASINSDRKLNLVLVANNFGTSDITITATDGHNSVTHTGTITINSVNDDPTGTVTIVGTTIPTNTLSVDLTQITDIENDSLTYTYLWQMSSDINTWTDVGTLETYIIPDTNNNYNKFLRVIVTIQDSDTNNNEIISNVVQIDRLDLVTSFTISSSSNEDTDYTFDLSTIIDSNYDVSFEIKTDDANGTSVIDTNKLLTFSPNANYNGSSRIIVTASTDSSVTSITQDITFNLIIVQTDDKPIGTVAITGSKLPNTILSVDLTGIVNLDNDTLTYDYLWQMSSDSNVWDAYDSNAFDSNNSNSTYTIPDTNDNEGKYVRVIVLVYDNVYTTEFISEPVQIEKLNLVTQFNIYDSNYYEDNNYVFDLSSIINNNYDVLFSIKTDDSNGSTSIDNNLLTFSPNNNYYGESTVIVTVSSPSITTITQDITFTINIQSVDDEATGTIIFTDNVIINQTITATANLTDIDGLVKLDYQWQVSDDNITFTNTENQGLNFVIPSDYLGKYIRLQVTSEDVGTSLRNFHGSGINSISTILENNERLYQGNSLFSPNGNYELRFQDSDGNLVLYQTGDIVLYDFNTQVTISDNQTNAYVVMEDGNLNIYDENGDRRFSYASNSTSGSLALDNNGNLSIIKRGLSTINSYSRQVKDVFGDIQVNTNSGDTVIKLENTHTDNTFGGESSLYYSNVTSSDANIVPTLSSTWDQIGSSIYGEREWDKSGNAVSLSSDGTIVAIGEYNEIADANSDKYGSVRVFERINNEWTQKGSKLTGEQEMDWFGDQVKLSGNGTKLFVGATAYDIDVNDPNNSNGGKLYIYTFTNNDWNLVNSIEGTGDNNKMFFDISDDGTIFAINDNFNNKIKIYEYNYNDNTYALKGSEISNNLNNFEDQISLSGDGNSILITDNGNNYYVYSYDNDWIQKGSTVISDQGRVNSSLKLNYDGSAFIYGGNQYNSRFVKTISAGADVDSVLTNFENEGYSLYTAYYGTNDGTNLSRDTKYETLNNSKLLNIYDYNKVRYDVYNFTGDFDSPQDTYIKTSYNNDIYKFNAESTETSNELYQIAGRNNTIYIRTSGYFSPKDTGYYRFVFNPTDDGVRIRMREFTNATDIESDSSSLIPLIRTNTARSIYFKYAVYDFNQNYSTPFDSTAGRLTNLSNTLLEWDSGAGNTSNWSALVGSTTENIFIRIEVVFTVSVSDTYYFEFNTDDGIRIKIVEYGDTKPNSNTASDWPSMEDRENSGFTNWQEHGENWFRYTKSLEKYKIYKAYIEYAQGSGDYYFENKNWRSGNNTLYKWHQQPEMILLDTMSTWDGTDHVWIDQDTFSSGGSKLDIGLDNIYLDSTKNYEFLIEFVDGGGAMNFNFNAEKTDTDSFTSSPSSISTEFVSLVNLKSKFEVLKDSNNQILSNSSDFNFYDPNVGVAKFTYLVFYIENGPGKNKVYEYKTDIEGNTDWYQIGNDILGLSPGGFGGWRTTLDKSARQIATTDVRHNGGTVRILKHDPIGTSIRNFYGSGINSSSIILANNERLYQGSDLVSPNGNYKLSFQGSDSNLVLYDISTSVNFLYAFNTQPFIGDNQTTAYAVMEDGNLNIYDENGDHRFSFTSDSTSGVLALDNNGNLSIVDNWMEVKRFSGGNEQGSGIDFSLDGSVIAIGTKNNNNFKGRTEIYELNNELTLGNVNSLTVGSSTDISFDIMDGTNIDTKTFTVSNIDYPTFGEVRILSNTINLYEGGTLTADTSSLTDPDSTVSIASYQWEISSDSTTYVSISNATNSTFTIPRDTESSFSYVGQYIRLKVSANGTDFYSDPKLVLNIEDEATGTISFTSNLTLIQEGAILTAVTNLSDVDNNKLVSNNSQGTLSLAYQWQISQDNTSFTNIGGATSNEYQIPIGTYTGQYIRLFITTTDTRSGTTNFVTTSSLIEVNSSPFFNTSPITTAYVGILYSYSFTFSDADENQTISITNISYPSWITFDTNNNTLSGTPTENDINDRDVSITISDGTNETIQSFSIYVNRAPYVGTDLNLTFDEDEVINPIDLDLYFSDYDNDTLNYTIDSYDTNLFTASIDSDRKLNLVLVANNFGTSDIIITATDGHNSVTHTGTITINSVNDEPTGTVTIVGTTLPNKELSVDLTQITDIENDSLTYTYLWQMSSDSNTWDSSSVVGTSSTYTIPDTNDNFNKYIRVIVTIEDSDTNNNEIISNVIQIQKINLITLFSISNTLNEDNDYTFDLSSIIDTNYDVAFEVKTDDVNGTSVIDTNKLLTFSPNNNYFGESTIIVSASTDSSVTSITQDITFNLTINSINDQPTGTIAITGVTLPNNELSVDLTQITDVENDALTYSFLWQMSSDSNIWDSSNDVATSSTYTIPDTNDNENKYIRVKVNVKDSDNINTEFISDEVQIQKLELVTSFTINESVNEDNNYTFDLSSIINNNYDVLFELKTDDVNGTSVIDSNKVLTFTPDQHYYGGSTIILTVSTNTSVTSITQDITFNITVNSVNDEPTGTVLIEGNALLNDTLYSVINVSDIENDVLEYSYSWEISNDENNWENSIVVGTESSYKIAENIDYVGQYIRLIVSIRDSDTNDNKIISSNILEISNVRLVLTDIINETILEDNNYVYNLNNVKDTNQNVYFAVNDVLNGQVSIDENDILTFIPDANYFGNATILLDVTTDHSITTMTQSLSFNLTIVSVNDEPTGPITIVGTTLPNKELSVDLTQITDVENDSLTYSFLWQMSSDNNIWQNVGTNSTYTIPDTNDNADNYIRVKVTIQDSDTNNNEIISNVIQIQKLDLITSFSESNTINEDNDYTFDLSSIINTDYDVSFEVKTDDVNGTSVIDTNKLLTFSPNANYFGGSTIIVSASTDSSVTSITQDITFNLTINSINDQPTGTIAITGITLPNNELSVDLTQITDVENDTLTYSFLWQMSSDSNVWDATNDVSISSTYIIPDTNNNENKYIRVKVNVKDSDNINTEFISDEVQIQKLDLITSFTINDTINEDNDYTFDLSSIINNNYNVSFEVKTDDINGNSVIDVNKLLTFTPNQHYYGESTIIVTASTETSVTSITQDITFTITVNSVNDTPVFNNGSFSTDEDVPTTFDLSSLTSDVENDLLTYTIVSAPTKGTALITGSTLSYSPFANLNGSDSVQVSVSDGNSSSSSTISITINPVNDAPQINNGSFSANEGIAKQFDLLTLNASDIDNNNLTYAVKTLPRKGDVSINDTTLTYKSHENEYGADSVVITVSDGELFTEATIDVLINAVPKVLNNFDDLRIEENSNDYIIDLSDKFIDADDTSLTYTATSNNTNLINVSVLGDKLTLSLVPNSKGETTIDVSATDNEVSVTNSFSVLVFRENELPVFDSAPVTVAYEDLLYEYNVQVSDVNVEDSSLTIEVIEKPDWLTFINNEYNRALLSGTPLVDHIGTHNVVLKVTDTVLESATQSFTITVIEVNDNPTFVSVPITEVDERSEYVYNIVVNDEENDNVSITVDSALIPSWLSLTQIDNNNAVLRGTPDKFDSGDYNIIITATDEHGKSNSQVFTLTVNNVNFVPVITSTPILYTLAHNLYTYIVTVDHDGEIDFEATKIPYWATFTDNNDNTATLTGIPDINEHFTVNIVIKEVGGLRTTINHDFSIKVDAEPYVKNTINDISIVTFDKFEYKLPEFNNSKYTNENTVTIKKSNLIRSDNWIFYDDSYNTVLGDTLSYELFINDNSVDTYDWITFTNGTIKIHPKFHHIGTYTFKVKATDIMGNNAETEFNVKINSSVIKFEKQFYNNNREALVELDSTDSTDALNKAHNYLDTHNLSQEKYNVIIFNTDGNKVQIYEGDNNNHTISDHVSIDTYVISKYLDNVRRTKQSIVIRPNKNLNIELI